MPGTARSPWPGGEESKAAQGPGADWGHRSLPAVSLAPGVRVGPRPRSPGPLQHALPPQLRGADEFRVPQGWLARVTGPRLPPRACGQSEDGGSELALPPGPGARVVGSIGGKSGRRPRKRGLRPREQAPVAERVAVAERDAKGPESKLPRNEANSVGLSSPEAVPQPWPDACGPGPPGTLHNWQRGDPAAVATARPGLREGSFPSLPAAPGKRA